MNGVINLFVNFYTNIFNLFNSVSFTLGDVQVTLASVMVICIVFTMVVGIYWRGAKG